MKNSKIDKLIILMGVALLGYYLAISFSPLKGIIWGALLRMLPPINDRHLPTIYIGIIGAVVFVLLGYLAVLISKKKSFTMNKKEYITALSLLIVAPLVIAGIFRLHSISLVNKAESSVPTRIYIQLNSEDSKIMFQTGENSASGFAKSIVINDDRLAVVGKLLRELERKDNNGESRRMDSQYTMFIRYEPNNKWYSRILSFEEGYFTESSSNGRVLYQNTELVKVIADSIKDAGDLEQYKRAEIINSEIIRKRSARAKLADEQLAKIKNYINRDNKIDPNEEVQKRFDFSDDGFVPQEETDIYGIKVMQDEGKTENIIVYDNLTKTLKFEGSYYKGDLSSLVKEI